MTTKDKVSKITPKADESAGEAGLVNPENHDSELSGKKVTVTFSEQEGDAGSEPIFASLNGYAYQIPRGIPVEIPVELLDIFKNAKMSLVETAQGGGTKTRSVQRFQYTVHG